MSNQKSYSEKLLDPRWQKKRLEILQRDEFKCQMCNDDKSTLHVHHFTYNISRNPWDADNDDLTTYCEVCHAIVEEYKPVPHYLIMSAEKILFENFCLVNCLVKHLDEGVYLISVWQYHFINKKLTMKAVLDIRAMKSVSIMYEKIKNF